MRYVRWFPPLLLLPLITSAALAQTPRGLALFMDFKEMPPPAVVHEMQMEVERLFGPGAAPVTWLALSENSGAGMAGKLAVIRFRGTCSWNDHVAEIPQGEPVVLGSTLVSDGRVLPFMDIRCDEVRSFLHTSHPSPSDRAYGRALGQIVAHELYHVLLETRRHSHAGISKAIHSSRELGQISNTFEPAVREKLIASLR